MDKKIIYPQALTRGNTIAVTAPSSGVENHLHHLLDLSRTNIQKLGFNVIEGETIWSNDKCVSASKEIRAIEIMNFLQDDNVNAIIPPWGGEFLMDILPLINWEKLGQSSPKWILGYSDISTFTFAYTLLTGIATAHGTNYIDLSANVLDSTSHRWLDVLQTKEGETIDQYSSKLHQSKWDFKNIGFNLDTPTEWKMLDQEKAGAKEISFSGRLLGGCLDTISILLGTSYAPVNDFTSNYCSETGVIWFLESCE
jgi:muramoyltetrapeptide carboxypeptidase